MSNHHETDSHETDSNETNTIELQDPLDELKCIIEGLLLAAGKALSVDQIIALLEEGMAPARADIRVALASLQEDYQNRGIELVEVASGFRFQVKEKYGHWVSRLWEEKPQKYSRALLETLALIAYRQPITRGDIEEIRGVAVSSNIMKTLLERNWVRVVGHRDVPGRPSIYATTRQFLDYFNLKSLEELPPLAEIRDLDLISKEVSQQLELGEGFEATSEQGEVESEETTLH